MEYSHPIIRGSILGLSLAMSACGGGGGSNSNSASQNVGSTGGGAGGNTATASFANRVTSVTYDYDNNGVADATDSILYDADGRVNLATYLYTDDGTPDILNLRDDGTVQETNTLSYDADGNVTLFVVDRQAERFENNFSYDDNGALSRVDFQFLNANGGQVAAIYWEFMYANQQLIQVDNFLATNNQLFSSQGFTYDTNDLPATSDFTSDGTSAITTMTWRDDGKLETLATESSNGTTSSVALTYDAQGLLQNEIWLNTGGLGFNYSEIPGRAYTRSITYDAQNRPVTVSYDQDSDGNVDATLTLTWEAAPCIPATIWAPNGFPNFVMDNSRPFVPGTGFFTTEYCAS